eukprot:s2483_g2.t1
MAFAPRPRTPTPAKNAGNGNGGSGGNATIQRLLEIVNQHGIQLESLREAQEALRQETEALRAALSADAPAKPRAATAGAKSTAICSQRPGSGPGHAVLLDVDRAQATTTNSETREAGAASTCSRRSGGTSSTGRGAGAKVIRTDTIRSARDAQPAVTTRSAHRSSSAPTTPRGASAPRAAAPRTATPRRSASGEPAQRSATPRRSRAKLFEVAQPLLQPGIPKEKRIIALSAFARCLKEGASASHWDGPQSPLRSAVQAQDSDMARLLLQARADPNDRDAKGVCVLHSASFDGLSDLCQSLLKARADANAADQHGQTAFFFAPNSVVCDVLLDGKADVNAVNQKGQSALHLASRAGLSEVLHWMAPRVSSEVLELRDVHGATAAYYARHAGIGYDFLVRHKFSAEAAGEEKSEKRAGRHSEPVESQVRGERTRSSWTSSRATALPPVLEDQLDGEEEEVPVASATTAADVEELEDWKRAEARWEVPVASATTAADVEEAELPGSSTIKLVPPLEDIQPLDMEVTSCFFEDSPESPTEHGPKEETSTLEAPDRSAPEGSSPASSLERADQMVTWEEDCGCPGFALTGSTADLSLGDSPVAPEAVGDGNSVASDVSDAVSPGKAARSKRRSSLNQVFLRPLDPLKAESTES